MWEYRQCTLGLLTIKADKEFPGTVRVEKKENKIEPIDDIQLTVPQLSGEVEVIDRLHLSQAMNNLGLYTSPDGSTTPRSHEI